MSLWGWVKERFQSQDVTTSELVRLWEENRPLVPFNDFRRLAEEGFRRNAIIFACIREIASSVTEPDIRVVRRDDQNRPIDVPQEHPLAALMRRPNPSQAITDFVEAISTHYDVSGNAYIHKIRSGMQRVVELRTLRPDRVRIDPDPRTGEVRGYKYCVARGPEVMLPVNDVIHIKTCDPLDDYYGLSPIAVAARFGDIDNNAADFIRAFFLNAGQPSALLSLKTKTKPKDRERLRRMWRDEYSGARGWHGLAVVDSNAEYREIGSRPDTLALEGIWGIAESRMCMAFGVPPILIQSYVGLLRSTLTNYRTARKSLWEETLVPRYKRFSDALTFGLSLEFGDSDLEVLFDTSMVEALRENEKERRDWIREDYKAGIVLLNEARGELGHDPVPGGDVFRYDPNTVFIAPGNFIGEGAPTNGNGQPAARQSALPSTRVIVLNPFDDLRMLAAESPVDIPAEESVKKKEP